MTSLNVGVIGRQPVNNGSYAVSHKCNSGKVISVGLLDTMVEEVIVELFSTSQRDATIEGLWGTFLYGP
jgi:hypothetical protein